MIRKIISIGMLFSLVFLAVSVLLCKNSFAFALPDTGQTSCYDSSGIAIDCAGTGQDGEHNINPMSYTDNGNGTVTDNVTGLMWQQQDDGNFYNWYQASGTYEATYNPSSQNVCGSLNLGDSLDWRLPTKKELIGIVDYWVPYAVPTIKTDYFYNTYLAGYWSSIPGAYYPNYAWVVHFDDGFVNLCSMSYYSMNVRCVRGGLYPKQSFIDNNNGTVTEKTTGLMWQQGEPGTMKWDSALGYCKGLSLGGYSDWRLPNIKELESITDDTMYDPDNRIAIDRNFFPNACSLPNAYSFNYWSSTTYASYIYPYYQAWSVDFGIGMGYIYHQHKSNDMYVRCTRGDLAIKKFNLAVTVNPTEGGMITSSPVSLVCSGNICQGSLNQGTSVTLTANPNAGWKFDYWDDGIACYYQNPLSVTMDADKTVTANFKWNEKILLTAADLTPLGNRTPLILVHGNNMETENQFGWKEYLREFRRDRVFQSRYKVYLLSWDSEQSNAYNGLAMGYLIDNLPELQNKDLTILAHSRGGIIARYFMNQYTVKGGNRKGQSGGEKVKWLVTLATPHRGSPAADEIWDRFSFDYNHWDATAKTLCNIVLSKRFYGDSDKFLLWDDWDNELASGQICWDSGCEGNNYCGMLMSKNSDLLQLNQNEIYYNKIVAIGGNRYDRRLADLHILQLLLSDWTEWIDLSQRTKHSLLTQSSRLIAEMPIIPNDYTKDNSDIDDSYRPFQANDGLVPLVSALFLNTGSGKLFQVNKKSELRYNLQEVSSHCLAGKTIILKGLTDHQDFLDNSQIINLIVYELKNL